MKPEERAALEGQGMAQFKGKADGLVKRDICKGLWFQSAVSGMWYQGSPRPAGQVSAVRVEGMLFARLYDPSIADKQKEYLDQIVKEILYGLTTDGGHHKQHSLEKVFRLLCEDSYVDKAKAEFQWKDGIPA